MTNDETPFSVSLAGDVALVTGASSGLGRHFARVLARSGAKVAAAARRMDKLADLVGEIQDDGGEAVAVEMDVTDGRSIESGLRHATELLGVPTILVNNAGVAQTKPLLEVTEADWDSVLDANLKGAFLVANATAALMAENGGGRIVNIASILGLGVSPQLTSYAVSKAGLIQLTKSMAVELARYDIRVNAIAPGYILTDINAAFFASDASAGVTKRIPQRRIGEPSDLDGPLLLLCSAASGFMTGSVIVVDGGHSLPI